MPKSCLLLASRRFGVLMLWWASDDDLWPGSGFHSLTCLRELTTMPSMGPRAMEVPTRVESFVVLLIPCEALLCFSSPAKRKQILQSTLPLLSTGLPSLPIPGVQARQQPTSESIFHPVQGARAKYQSNCHPSFSPGRADPNTNR